MNIKQYTNKDGSVTYTYSLQAKKWEFKIPAINTTFLTPVPTRAIGAAKIANILAGSVKRSNAVDNLARANIARLIG